MYNLEIKPIAEDKFFKLSKKNRFLLEVVNKKVDQILENPYHFKPLHAPMNHLRRVHIAKSFVLTFRIDENIKTVVIIDFDHHDSIYKC